MRRIVIVIVISITIVSLLNPAAYAQNPLRKLGRGLANVATGWVELPAEIGRKTVEKGDIAGVFVAPFTGTLKALGRTLAGVYDTATFFMPLPAGYAPLIEPEFVMQEN